MKHWEAWMNAATKLPLELGAIHFVGIGGIGSKKRSPSPTRGPDFERLWLAAVVFDVYNKQKQG